jgi:glyoxylase-like metal-dependent hydrolase (beta-lactamase superfamily II)
MEIGQVRIDPVIDGQGSFNPVKVFRSSTDQQWAAHADLLDANGRLPFVMGGFLVRGNGRTTLVDLGLGEGTLLGITGGSFMNHLATYGVAAEDVTDVVFTHLHVDHIGWGVRDGKPTFPNATYRSSQADVDHFVHGSGADEREKATLDVIGSRIVPWDAGSTCTILPGIDQFAAPGHTPGSSVIVVNDGSERALLLGDVVHCAVQLIDDEWSGMFDVDPELAKRTRNDLAREIEGDPTIVAGAHFPDLKFGRLLRGEGRRFWQT